MERQFRLSPDGTSIALWRSGALSLGPVATGIVNAVAEGVRMDGFQWSPDSRRIAYISYSPTGPLPSLWVADADGSGATKIHDTGGENWQAISWNSSKGLLSLMRAPTGTDTTYYASRVFLTTPDGKGFGFLAPIRDGRMFASWSPDGSRIVFMRVQTETKVPARIDRFTLWTGAIR